MKVLFLSFQGFYKGCFCSDVLVKRLYHPPRPMRMVRSFEPLDLKRIVCPFARLGSFARILQPPDRPILNEHAEAAITVGLLDPA